MKWIKYISFFLMIVFIGFYLIYCYIDSLEEYRYFERIDKSPLFSETFDLGKKDTIHWTIRDKDWQVKRILDGTAARLDLVDSENNVLHKSDDDAIDVKIEAYSFLKNQNDQKVNRLILNDTYDTDRPFSESKNNFGFASVRIYGQEELFIELIIIEPDTKLANKTCRLRLKGEEMIHHSGYGRWIGKFIHEIMLAICLTFLLIILGQKTYTNFRKRE